MTTNVRLVLQNNCILGFFHGPDKNDEDTEEDIRMEALYQVIFTSAKQEKLLMRYFFRNQKSEIQSRQTSNEILFSEIYPDCHP